MRKNSKNLGKILDDPDFTTYLGSAHIFSKHPIGGVLWECNKEMAILGSDVAVIDGVGLQMELQSLLLLSQTIFPAPANISMGLGESSTPLAFLPCLMPMIRLNIDSRLIDAMGRVGQHMEKGTPWSADSRSVIKYIICGLAAI